MDYHEMTDKLSDKLMEVRTEGLKGKFSESVIATRQATAALEFFANLKGITMKGDWSVVLNQLLSSENNLDNCRLSSICKHYERKS